MRKHLLFILLCTVRLSWGQDLTVPEDILKELKTVQVELETDTFTFRVAYPVHYSPEKEYKCFIGLSGGSQSMEIVNYCYASWFRSGYFREYITVLPVVKTDTVNFKDYTPDRINILLTVILEKFNVKPGWLIAGTSNGGVAAFNFIAAYPEKFEGLIVAPGMLAEQLEPSQSWNHLKVILACGSLDDPAWIKATKATEKRIKKHVSSVQRVPLQNQGHILPISFNADKMYEPYFLGKR